LTAAAGVLRPRHVVAGFCTVPPSPADRPPRGAGWVHEIKYDGFRLMVRRNAAGLRLITRNGHDWSGRFPLIAEAARALKVRSFLMDGEAVACDGDGVPALYTEIAGATDSLALLPPLPFPFPPSCLLAPAELCARRFGPLVSHCHTRCGQWACAFWLQHSLVTRPSAANGELACD
jgi:ATP dependent DNA ligase domain